MSGNDVNNGDYHNIIIEVSSNGSIQLYLDCATDDNCPGYEAVTLASTNFNTIAPFYIGGVEPTSRESSYHLTSVTPFVGSIRDLSINGELLSLLPNSSSTTSRSRNVVVGYQRTNQCENQPCMNGGQCIDLWFDYQCRCPPAYNGRFCDFLFLITFDNNSYLYIEHAMPIMSLSLQFSTLNEDGVLLSTQNVSPQLALYCLVNFVNCLFTLDNKWSRTCSGTDIRQAKCILYKSFQHMAADWGQCKQWRMV